MKKYSVVDKDEVMGYYYAESPEGAIMEFKDDMASYRLRGGVPIRYDFRTLQAILEENSDNNSNRL